MATLKSVETCQWGEGNALLSRPRLFLCMTDRIDRLLQVSPPDLIVGNEGLSTKFYMVLSKLRSCQDMFCLCWNRIWASLQSSVTIRLSQPPCLTLRLHEGQDVSCRDKNMSVLAIWMYRGDRDTFGLLKFRSLSVRHTSAPIAIVGP